MGLPPCEYCCIKANDKASPWRHTRDLESDHPIHEVAHEESKGMATNCVSKEERLMGLNFSRLTLRTKLWLVLGLMWICLVVICAWARCILARR